MPDNVIRLEALEARQLLSVSAHLGGSGTYRIFGTSGDDALTLQLDSSTTNVQLVSGASVVDTELLSSVKQIQIFGMGGNDTITIDTGVNANAMIFEGDGNDAILSASTGNTTVWAGSGDDNVTLGNGNNVINTGGGNDVVLVGNGNNTISVGGGTDSVTAGNGNNTVTGGSGNDSMVLGTGNNTVVLGAGSNVVTTGAGNDSINAISGADSITTHGNDLLQVNANDTVAGAANDTVWAGSGDTHITGVLSANILSGYPITATLASNGTLNITGSKGADDITIQLDSSGTNIQVLQGSTVVSTDLASSVNSIQINGKGGDDSIAIGATVTTRVSITDGGGNDVIVDLGTGQANITAGNGTDAVTVADQKANITVGNGNDIVTAGDGNDVINIGSGNDTIVTGNGNSSIELGGGNSTVTSGTGNDTIVTGGGADNITTNGADLITVDSSDTLAGTGNDTVYAGSAGDTNITGVPTANIHDSYQHHRFGGFKRFFGARNFFSMFGHW